MGAQEVQCPFKLIGDSIVGYVMSRRMVDKV